MQGPTHMPTVGSYGVAISHKRGSPVLCEDVHEVELGDLAVAVHVCLSQHLLHLLDS